MVGSPTCGEYENEERSRDDVSRSVNESERKLGESRLTGDVSNIIM